MVITIAVLVDGLLLEAVGIPGVHSGGLSGADRDIRHLVLAAALLVNLDVKNAHGCI